MTMIPLYPVRNWRIDFFLAVVWIFSFIALGYSFYQQYLAGIQPCLLCQLQRIPYFLIFFLAPIGFLSHCNPFIRVFIQLCLVASIGLALYQIMIQFGVINEQCTLNQPINNKEDFYLMLEKPSPSCSSTAWKIFGFPITGYNLAFSLLFLFFSKK